MSLERRPIDSIGCMGRKGPLIAWIALALAVVACAAPTAEPTAEELGLTADQYATLASLEQIDDHPLYLMHHYAPEPLVALAREPASSADSQLPAWGCSLFAALAHPGSMVFGRNFDWDFSPALLLFNHPAEGYESAAMVDIEYLGYPGEASRGLTERPLGDLTGLLDAPRIPFDGMNEAGLTIAMAAVPATQVPWDPSKDTVDSLGVIRVALDTAATVDEAIRVFRSLNVDFAGQTPLHYLMADSTGAAAVLEYQSGEIRVLSNEAGWLHATNFLLSGVDSAAGQCERYDTISAKLESMEGELGLVEAFELLEDVAQPHTQWSIAYGMSTGDIEIVMGRDFGGSYHFAMPMRE